MDADQRGTVVTMCSILSPRPPREPLWFYVPEDIYDLLDLTASMPTAADISQTQMEWTLNKDEDLENVFNRTNEKGERTKKITNDEAGSDKKLQLQWATANSQISLWP
jgi:hypothetical protein